MPSMRCVFLCLCAMFVATVFAQSTPPTFQSSERQTAVIELYTSEGCSSCPPAETWLSRLKESPGLWKNFVPLAFHVDYWDYLGWRDPWASKSFFRPPTRLRKAMALRFHLHAGLRAQWKG